jgi:hypothetical protein
MEPSASQDQQASADTGRLLERHLQSFLAANIGAALDIPLKLLSTERALQDVGRIDILAEGPLGSIWAIELKIGCASRDAVAQLSSYLGALQTEGIEAQGILIASDFDASAMAAVRAVPSVYCYSYGVEFSFKPAGERRIDRKQFELTLEPIGGATPKWPDSMVPPAREKGQAESSPSPAAAWPFPTKR